MEVIVVDDGSTDGCLEHLELLKKRKYQNLIILTHPEHRNKGVSASRYLGISQSKGDFIAFLDCDDIFLPDKLKAQINLLALFSDVIMFHTGIKIIGDRTSSLELEAHFSSAPGKPYSLRDQSYYLKQNNICNSSVLVNADDIKKISFSTSMLYQYEDWAYWSLLSERGKFILTDDQHIAYRVHEHSFSHGNDKSIQKVLFSKLECQLVLISRAQNIAHTFRILLAIVGTLRELYKSYYPRDVAYYAKKRISSRFLNRLRSAIYGI